MMNIHVRVPTHEEGTCLFWEFATDDYDLGFGLYFEWTLAESNTVTVHVTESDEEDFEENANEDKKGDVEVGKSAQEAQSCKPQTDEIVPVYRRDCHEEVHAGSHVYPGRGVYLLKFDNTYSLWRSKCLYYRIYYKCPNPENFPKLLAEQVEKYAAWIDDIRPGVCKTRAAARSNFLEVKRQKVLADSKRRSKQNRTVTEQERTLLALEKPLDDCNKGFKMLVKMGFQPGAALGKRKAVVQADGDEVHDDDQTPQTSSAIKEPIKIDLKHDRKGLGHGTKEKEKLLALEKSRKDIPKPVKAEFWPRYAQQIEENDGDIEQQDDEKVKNEKDYQYLISSTTDMLIEINKYLREKYSYCCWCAIQYGDGEDMKRNCPGPAESDHDNDSLDD
uniref:G patch domain-containing protein 11 n=1 Tax=Romanomermis culicivorax TaxID=13658 RepID=A0A915K2M8_ROMCU